MGKLKEGRKWTILSRRGKNTYIQGWPHSHKEIVHSPCCLTHFIPYFLYSLYIFFSPIYRSSFFFIIIIALAFLSFSFIFFFSFLMLERVKKNEKSRNSFLCVCVCVPSSSCLPYLFVARKRRRRLATMCMAAAIHMGGGLSFSSRCDPTS